MRKLKIKSIYFDTELNRNSIIGEIIEVSDKRAEVILNHPMGLAEEIFDVVYIEVPKIPTKRIAPSLPRSIKDQLNKKPRRAYAKNNKDILNK